MIEKGAACFASGALRAAAKRDVTISGADRRVRALVADRLFARFHGVTWEAVAKSKQIDSLEDPVRLSDALCRVQACTADSMPAAITCVLLQQAW
jgi:hypothetical protein